MAIEQLKEALAENCPEITSCHGIISPAEGLEYLKHQQVDLLLLDVEMPEMNAFEFIDLVGVENLPPLVFTSAYSQYAVRAFKVNALDYLLKPIDDEELKQAVEKVINQKSANTATQLNSLIKNPPQGFNERITLAEGQSYHFVKIQDIIRVESSGSYCVFHLESAEKITLSRPMNTYEPRLAAHGFIRSHQSHLVNPHYVKSYSLVNGGELILENNDLVPVSVRRRSFIRQQLGLK